MHMLTVFALIHHALGALAARLDGRDVCESHIIIVEMKFNALNRSRLNLSDITRTNAMLRCTAKTSDLNEKRMSSQLNQVK